MCEGLRASWRPEEEAHLDPLLPAGSVAEFGNDSPKCRDMPINEKARGGKAHPGGCRRTQGQEGWMVTWKTGGMPNRE